MTTDWLFTARPRLGAIAGNYLFYGTGGLAVSRLTGTWSTGVQGTPESASVSTTRAGWTGGGGFEAQLPGRYTIGLEYLYVRFDGISASAHPTTGPGFTLDNVAFHSAILGANIVRLRLNKSF
jgi:outer membrane immunogenic protein